MNKSQFDLATVNKKISRDIQGQELDFCQLLHRAIDDELSVVGKLDTSIKSVTLTKDLTTVDVEDGKAYYGVSPLLDNKLLIEAISLRELSSTKQLQEFISKHAECFFIHKEWSDYLLPLAKYIVIAAASNFKVSFYADQAEVDDFKLEEVKSAIKKEEIDGKIVVSILGCPTEQTLEYLEKYTYEADKNKQGLFKVKKDGSGKHIKDIYEDKSNIVLAGNSVFYSGVLLKTTRIELQENVYENYKTNAVCMYFEPSTFATVFALDNNFTSHPLFCMLEKEERQKVVQLLNEDDAEKLKMINGLKQLQEKQTPKTIIPIINEYLSNSKNVNQIGVSANVTTSDNMLLIGKRSKKSIDSSCLYPGVNGNAELADQDVSFYHYSVSEDVPTIKAEDNRIDFLGEISREAYAEIRLQINESEFLCNGIVISGNIPQESKEERNESIEEEKAFIYDKKFRRCHFNLLYSYKAEKDYESIIEGSERANEAFETEKMQGLSVTCYKNVFSLLWLNIYRGIVAIIKSKDALESLLVLMLAIITLKQSQTQQGFSFYLSLALSFFVLIFTALRVIKALTRWMKKIQTCSSVRFFKGQDYETIAKATRKAISKYAYHPVAYACIYLHVERTVYQAFFDEGRRNKNERKKSKKRKK